MQPQIQEVFSETTKFLESLVSEIERLKST